MKVYAFVPAKATSERVENKNIQFLNGEMLYIRALKILLQCKEIDKVILDTESSEMYAMADYLPITFMHRDPMFANNQTDGHVLFMNEVMQFPDGDIYVQLLCTSPFIKPETIDAAIRELKQNAIYDSAILMKKDVFYLWQDNRPTYDIHHIPNSKDLPETTIETMGLYMHKKESALKLKRRYGDNPLMIFASLEEAIDINTPKDLDFANTYALGLKGAENRRLNIIKHFMTSPAFSDLLDDMTMERGEICGAIIPHWQCNMSRVHTKILGRANTLKLRQLSKGEDFRDIYKALDSYKGIGANDVIVVENEMKEYAYFGGLNAHMAIKAGASAAIIDGATRDLIETVALDFPVYSRCYNARDVRRHATVDYINKPIQIDGTVINPGDLIFMDDCAMVVIYKKFEHDILSQVVHRLIGENKIVADIIQDVPMDTILKKHGSF